VSPTTPTEEVVSAYHLLAACCAQCGQTTQALEAETLCLDTLNTSPFPLAARLAFLHVVVYLDHLVYLFNSGCVGDCMERTIWLGQRHAAMPNQQAIFDCHLCYFFGVLCRAIRCREGVVDIYSTTDVSSGTLCRSRLSTILYPDDEDMARIRVAVDEAWERCKPQLAHIPGWCLVRALHGRVQSCLLYEEKVDALAFAKWSQNLCQTDGGRVFSSAIIIMTDLYLATCYMINQRYAECRTLLERLAHDPYTLDHPACRIVTNLFLARLMLEITECWGDVENLMLRLKPRLTEKYSVFYGSCCMLAARAAAQQDQLDRAVVYAKQAHRWAATYYSPTHHATLNIAEKLSTYLVQVPYGREECFELLGNVCSLRGTTLGQMHLATIESQQLAARCLAMCEEFHDAATLAAFVTRKMVRVVGRRSLKTLTAMDNLLAYRVLGDFHDDSTLRLARKVVQWREQLVSGNTAPDRMAVTSAENRLAIVHMQRKEYAEAARLLKCLKADCVETYGLNHGKNMCIRRNLAVCENELENLSSALCHVVENVVAPACEDTDLVNAAHLLLRLAESSVFDTASPAGRDKMLYSMIAALLLDKLKGRSNDHPCANDEATRLRASLPFESLLVFSAQEIDCLAQQ